ncbi:hypothetical protein KSD_32210 [Ktedonobacter sp. SOSP1-85]|uniref:Uncharacterized protein n=1 Tax=Ktedonobacter robiniae TaxID=2778365 RepID=A0ABQ3UJS9_9CHLR|nr:hypothetical protein KSB_14620 [Ktedonobacter robiniae]GHO69530.1 hypothetical protein KSC_084220 [Ktedonobacter sp. SOSP1-52]GHO75450.1 hypothetical protein KSD_32210 [Ktedonobacter sp. SOSP1-85]
MLFSGIHLGLAYGARPELHTSLAGKGKEWLVTSARRRTWRFTILLFTKEVLVELR